MWANVGAFHVCLWTFTLTEAWAWGRTDGGVGGPLGLAVGQRRHAARATRTSGGRGGVSCWARKSVRFYAPGSPRRKFRPPPNRHDRDPSGIRDPSNGQRSYDHLHLHLTRQNTLLKPSFLSKSKGKPTQPGGLGAVMDSGRYPAPLDRWASNRSPRRRRHNGAIRSGRRIRQRAPLRFGRRPMAARHAPSAIPLPLPGPPPAAVGEGQSGRFDQPRDVPRLRPQLSRHSRRFGRQQGPTAPLVPLSGGRPLPMPGDDRVMGSIVGGVDDQDPGRPGQVLLHLVPVPLDPAGQHGHYRRAPAP